MSVATIEFMKPANLTIDINVRKDANLTPEFLASIKEHGVIQPVVAHRTGDTTAHVLMGQRRTLAAASPRADANSCAKRLASSSCFLASAQRIHDTIQIS